MANELEITTTYSAKGIVVGRCWNFQLAGYNTVNFTGFNSEEELTEFVLSNLKENKGIDAGMGFERMLVVALNIKETHKTMIGNREFTHEFIHNPVILSVDDITENDYIDAMDIIDTWFLS